MKKSILFKTFFGYLLITLALSCLILVFSFKTVKHYYINSLTGELQDLCQVLKPQITSYLNTNNSKGLDSFVKSIDLQIHKRITVITPDGTVLADSQKDPKTMENHKNRPEIAAALAGKTGTSIRYSSTIFEDMLYAAVPVEQNGKTAVILRVSLFLKNVNSLLHSIKMHIMYITLLIILAALIAAYLFSRNMLIPITHLNNAAKKVADGDFNIQVMFKRNDEFKALADTFNNMTTRINGLFGEVSEQKNELNTIINSIVECLFVIESSGRIKLFNESFKKLVQNENIDGRFYWEVLRMPGFKEILENAMKNGTNAVSQLEIGGKIFSLSIAALLSKKEFVVVLHDITQIKNLENKKKEFISNVSHELRTPLTAIKGFTETLESETSKEGKHYLEVMQKHTDRLINIVKDLLSLSELEENGFELDKTSVNIKDMIKDVAKIFEVKLKEKNIRFLIEVKESMKPLNVDQFKLEQVFINLIDNAIKYTEKGEIIVSLEQTGRDTLITVSDTGTGIPKESLPYIFERFYVADKSRSKKLGGTGLGLAIVKHIVLLHNGTITAESEVDKGTKFIVSLPNS